MYLETWDRLYITWICFGLNKSMTTFWWFTILLVRTSVFIRAQFIMLLYGMSFGRVAILWSPASAISMSLFSFFSFMKFSGQFLTSCSKISKICIQDRTKSTTCGVVLDITSEFRPELSPASSFFFCVFLGAMIPVIRSELLLQRRRPKLSQIQLTNLLKVRKKFELEIFIRL